MITLKQWLIIYREILNDRLLYNEINKKTHAEYELSIRRSSDLWGDAPLIDISVSDIATSLSNIQNEGKFSTAYRFKIHLKNMFVEAQRDGVIPIHHNPAVIVRTPRRIVKTERLLINEWRLIFEYAKYRAPEYFSNSMLLALVTGQRISDIVTMHHDHIFNNHLHIIQMKTNERIAIPLSLSLDEIGFSLSDVVSMCSQRNHLLTNNRGNPVNTWSLSRWFKICRDAVLTPTQNKKLPSFREQRSLSERLYRTQGVDTMTLLGHKHQYMTDSYNDIRSKDYRYLRLK
ncbi:tyrosine-type recombinase/integrase [Proteus terrae]|uniref:tyrosine-type recombinase/integrase n=1 Tax=Proteus terrae TaxID=1574161 RepID=UPI00331580DF